MSERERAKGGMPQGQPHSVAPDGLLDPMTMGGFIAEATNRHQDRDAFRYNGETMTYGELGERIYEFARGLAAVGVTKGTRVGILLGNRPEWIVATFGAALLGAIAVPMSTFATADERQHMLRHADVTILVTQESLLSRNFVDELTRMYPDLECARPGAFYDTRVPHLRRVFCLGRRNATGAVETWDDLVERGRQIPDGLVEAMAANVSPADDALIQYTSGSTALPKAVLHYQRTPPVKFREYVETYGIQPTDRVLAPQQFFWAFAQVPGAALAGGACFVCMERFDGQTALELIEKYRITVVQPAGYQTTVLSELAAEGNYDLSSLRVVVRPGFTPTAELRERAEFACGYGLTENFTAVTTLPYNAPLELRQTTNGLPPESVTVEIVDPVTGVSLPPGQDGEIAIKGRTVMRGYYKMEPERCFDERGFYRTKDMGLIDADGYLHYIGRASTMIKTSGANVSPTEVQDALMSSGLVAIAAVVGVAHPVAGEAVVALVAPKQDARPSEEELKAHVKTRIAAYKVPRRILFLREDEMPTTGTGKIDFGNSRELAAKRLVQANDDPKWADFLREA